MCGDGKRFAVDPDRFDDSDRYNWVNICRETANGLFYAGRVVFPCFSGMDPAGRQFGAIAENEDPGGDYWISSIWAVDWMPAYCSDERVVFGCDSG